MSILLAWLRTRDVELPRDARVSCGNRDMYVIYSAGEFCWWYGKVACLLVATFPQQNIGAI
jgi:hypothetical protein